jgi:8-oxo-dGTP diphosphatase
MRGVWAMPLSEEDRMSEQQGEGCQIVLIDESGRVLLQLRDEKDWIPFPGMWALPGGMLEEGETPAECIRREVFEEMGIELAADRVRHVETRRRSYGVEHTFTAGLTIDAGDIDLTEGQAVEWFTAAEVARMTLAFEDGLVLSSFLARLDERDATDPGLGRA